MYGRVQEWLNWHAWKVCKGAIFSRVRIPLLPPSKTETVGSLFCLMKWRSENLSFLTRKREFGVVKPLYFYQLNGPAIDYFYIIVYN